MYISFFKGKEYIFKKKKYMLIYRNALQPMKIKAKFFGSVAS